MEVVKDLQYGKKEVEKLKFRLIREERNFLCMRCMRVVKSGLFLLVLDDETQAIWHFHGASTVEKPFICKECSDKEVKSEEKR